MRVGILGSSVLDFRAEDMFRYVQRIVYPHEIDTIVTTKGEGVMATARDIAESKGLGLYVCGHYRQVVEECASVVIFRSSTEYPTYAKYCSRRGRPFREYVLTNQNMD